MSTYTTVQGDTWDRIAYTQLGNTGYTKDLMWVNQDYLDFFTFPAGIVIQLPEQKVTLESTSPPWKQVNG